GVVTPMVAWVPLRAAERRVGEAPTPPPWFQLTWMVALRAPVAVGVKIPSKLKLPPAATISGRAGRFVSVQSPPTLMAVTVIGPVPVLFTTWFWLEAGTPTLLEP